MEKSALAPDYDVYFYSNKIVNGGYPILGRHAH